MPRRKISPPRKAARKASPASPRETAPTRQRIVATARRHYLAHGFRGVTMDDLAQELGVYGTPRQNEVLDEHRMRLIAAASAHGKHTAMLVDSLEEAERWIKAGVTIIAYSSDVAVLRTAYASAAARLTPANP